MRYPAKITLVSIVGLAMLLALLIAYSTASGYMMWWFPSRGSVRINGVTSGYLHKNWWGTAAIITRTDLKPSQSYLVGFDTSETSKSVIHCGDWHAPHFVVFPIGDVNPPCSFFFDDSQLQRADLPIPATLSIRPRVIEFSTMRGEKVTATW